MFFLNLLADILLLGGIIAGYWFATWQKEPRRWHVVAACTAGGAASAILVLCLLLVSELSHFQTLRPDILRFVSRYTLLGFVLGLVMVATPWSIRNWLSHSSVMLAKRTWQHRRQVIAATVGAQLTVAAGVWLHTRLFPAPSAYVHVDAPRDSVRSARLPDGTEVILSPGSHLSYSTWFSPHEERDLTVTGEGTFAVARGARRSLTLRAGGAEVTASNAHFTVHADSAQPVASVTVQDGTIQVRARRFSDSSQVLTLSRSEGARVGPKLRIARVDSLHSSPTRFQ
jgi:ferric-dicitrate binding protein FerR (iron transport regulator)